MKPRSRGGPNTSDVTPKQGGSPNESSMGPSPPVARRVTSQPSTGNGSYAPQQYGDSGPVNYPDVQTMEFLQNIGATSNGEFANTDQAGVDLGFGMNWENLHHDFAAEGQQMNPFDSFFFGGPQGNGNGGNNDGGVNM